MGSTPSHHPFIDGIFHYKPSSFGISPFMDTSTSDGDTLVKAGGLMIEWAYFMGMKTIINGDAERGI